MLLCVHICPQSFQNLLHAHTACSVSVPAMVLHSVSHERRSIPCLFQYRSGQIRADKEAEELPPPGLRCSASGSVDRQTDLILLVMLTSTASRLKKDSLERQKQRKAAATQLRLTAHCRTGAVCRGSCCDKTAVVSRGRWASEAHRRAGCPRSGSIDFERSERAATWPSPAGTRTR